MKFVKDILFVRKVAGLMPFLAELAAAAQIGHRINAARVEPDTAH